MTREIYTVKNHVACICLKDYHPTRITDPEKANRIGRQVLITVMLN